mmetsp:Transcript_145763/g.254331  ORF Transcript_145763/g.254331 Transcript_145763/m.254331 type:complete len:225 (-) Transcript_145763:53-727(-)
MAASTPRLRILTLLLEIGAVASQGLTNLTVTAANGSVQAYEAAPARWNAWQPKLCPAGSRWRCLCPQPTGPLLPAVNGPLVPAPALGFKGLGHACKMPSFSTAALAPPPRRGGAVALARRGGGCSFEAKVLAAEALGYCGLLVANEDDGPPHPYYGLLELPDMTTQDDSKVGIPAWLVSKSAGDEIFQTLSSGAALVEARDDPRKPALGHAQQDLFGIRDHHQE